VTEPPPIVVHARANSRARWFVPALLLAIAAVLPAHAQPAPEAAAAKPRPKIGLVLSGGGARGFTHIGVLKVLHELRIPIDYIAATSMGAIVGGLYASGMTPDEMQRQLGAVSWPTILSDSPERRDVGFRRKEVQTAFPLALEFGYRDGELLWFKGALSGANLELFLHELTRKVDNIDNFDKLPIPYRAVATNMITGKEVVFASGRLYQAMRASMSVPGMFAPMEIDGRILGDGGLVNNLPVDIVRQMGADIVIAVNIGTPLMSRDQLQSVVGYASQMLNILTEQNVRAQLALLKPTDILISPDLGNLTFIDFAAGPEFVELGEKAAEAVRPQLMALADSPERYAAYERKLAVPATVLPEKLDFVTIEGTHYANPEVLEAQMRTKPDEPFKLETLESDMARLYGRGDFEHLDYQLMTVGNQTGVVINVMEKTWGPNFLRFGATLSTDFQGETYFNLLLGHRRVWLNSLGGEWSNEVILGSTRRYATEFYQPLTLGRSLFASAYGLVQRAPEFIFEGDKRVAEYDVLTETAGADIGWTFGTSGELRVGLKYIHWRGDPTVSDNPIFATIKTDETGARVLLRWDTLDHPYFPRRGLRANVEAFFGTRTTTLFGQTFDNDNSSRGFGFIDAAWSPTPSTALNFHVRAGAITNARAKNVINDFNLGGFLQLSGLRTNQLSGNYMAFGRVVGYHQIATLPVVGRAIYIGGSIEAGNTWECRTATQPTADEPGCSKGISAVDMFTAGSVFLAADTWLGPFYVGWGYASGGHRSFYLYLGRL
jgi:NTE family protein